MPSLKDLPPHTLRELYGSRVIGGRVVMTQEQAGQTYHIAKKALARETADPWAEAAARVMAEERAETGKERKVRAQLEVAALRRTGRPPSPGPQSQSMPGAPSRDAQLLAKLRADRSGSTWREYPDGRREPVHASEIDDLDYAENDPEEEGVSNYEVEYTFSFNVVVHGDGEDDGCFVPPTAAQLRRALMAKVAELNRGGDSAWTREFVEREEGSWETDEAVTPGYEGCPTTLPDSEEELQP